MKGPCLMTNQQSVSEELRGFVERNQISYHSLAAITSIEADTLRAFADASPEGLTSPQSGSLSLDEGERVSVLVSQLTAIREIPDSDRVEGILAALTQTYGFTIPALAALLGVEQSSLESLSESFDSVPEASRTALAVRLTFLVNAINLAGPRL